VEVGRDLRALSVVDSPRWRNRCNFKRRQEEEEEGLTFILGVCQPRNLGCAPGPEAKKKDRKRRK
jgi:hypothetical protein